MKHWLESYKIALKEFATGAIFLGAIFLGIYMLSTSDSEGSMLIKLLGFFAFLWTVYKLLIVLGLHSPKKPDISDKLFGPFAKR